MIVLPAPGSSAISHRRGPCWASSFSYTVRIWWGERVDAAGLDGQHRVGERGVPHPQRLGREPELGAVGVEVPSAPGGFNTEPLEVVAEDQLLGGSSIVVAEGQLERITDPCHSDHGRWFGGQAADPRTGLDVVGDHRSSKPCWSNLSWVAFSLTVRTCCSLNPFAVVAVISSRTSSWTPSAPAR